MTWAADRLDALVRGGVTLPPVVETMQLGALDAWGPGWARKRWIARPELMNADGSMFGGYLAALADQIMAFAAMTVVPGDKIFRTAGLHVEFLKLVRGPLDIESRVTAHSEAEIAVEADFRIEGGGVAARAAATQRLLQAPAGLV